MDLRRLIFLALVLSSVFTVIIMARVPGVSRGFELLCDLVRCIPFLLLLYIFYYCLPAIEIRMDRMVCGVSVLTVYHTAYLTEILKGAWARLPQGQEDAAKSFGYRGIRLFLRIIAPQIFISSAPLIGNQAVAMIKDSAFLMIITIPELTFVANSIQARYFLPLVSLFTAAMLYWVLCLGVEFIIRRLNRLTEARSYE